ncbi:MAG: hypothetical protein U0838_16075 [Chloroflexota bacterium]
MQSHEPLPGWRNGLDPAAAGMIVRSIGRGRHHLGDAFRLELADPGPGTPPIVHVQWVIATRMGPWAMWTACRPEDMGSRDAELQAIDWFGDDVPGEPLALVKE